MSAAPDGTQPGHSPARELLAPLAAVAIALVLLGGALLQPGRVLAVRDVPQFHLPLRTTAVHLAAQGLPEWNPWIAGGQPLLSDPSYALFYPATWLAFLVGAEASLRLGLLLHLALAAAGAFGLARHLGARPWVGAFAALAYAGGGSLLSLALALNHLPGAAWLPWIVLEADRVAAAGAWRAARGALLRFTLYLALALLNGEPITVGCALFAAACLVLGRGGRDGRGGRGGRRALAALPRLAAGAALALALAAIQLVPTAFRFAASERGQGLDWETASAWSMPPARLLELVVPHLFGDPARADESLYFGWGIHDLDFPFLATIFPGVLVLALGLAALLRPGVPGRAGWALMTLSGLLLALGRHGPVYRLLYDHLPLASSLRYPEKFFLLAGAGLAFAAALGLEEILARRDRGDRGGADLPIALAGVAFLLLAAGTALIELAPGRLEDFIAAHAGFTLSARKLDAAIDFYRHEARLALALAAAALALLAALRWRRPSASVAAALLVALLAVELVRVDRPLLATLPAAAYAPSPLARQLAGLDGRIWSSAGVDQRRQLLLDEESGGRGTVAARLERLDPWAGAIWGLDYALTGDYALTFTAPLRRAVATTEELWTRRDRGALHRWLGAWSVERTIVRRDSVERALSLQRGESPPPLAEVGGNPFALPRVRLVAGAVAYADTSRAVAGALADGLDFGHREHLATSVWRGERTYSDRGRVLSSRFAADRLMIDLETAEPALVVVAMTWDSGWSARVDGAESAVLEAAAGYLAVELPAGARRVELAFRQSGLVAGAATSAAAALALLAMTAIGALGGRGRMRPPRP